MRMFWKPSHPYINNLSEVISKTCASQNEKHRAHVYVLKSTSPARRVCTEGVRRRLTQGIGNGLFRLKRAGSQCTAFIFHPSELCTAPIERTHQWIATKVPNNHRKNTTMITTIVPQSHDRDTHCLHTHQCDSPNRSIHRHPNISIRRTCFQLLWQGIRHLHQKKSNTGRVTVTPHPTLRDLHKKPDTMPRHVLDSRRPMLT